MNNQKEDPFILRSCYDCANLKAVVNWWCRSKEAIEARGTAIPGCIRCPYWKPDWNYIDKEYKTQENGYIKPKPLLKKIRILTKIKFYLKWIWYFNLTIEYRIHHLQGGEKDYLTFLEFKDLHLK